MANGIQSLLTGFVMGVAFLLFLQSERNITQQYIPRFKLEEPQQQANIRIADAQESATNTSTQQPSQPQQANIGIANTQENATNTSTNQPPQQDEDPTERAAEPLAFCPSCIFNPKTFGKITCLERANYFVTKHKFTKELAQNAAMTAEPKSCKTAGGKVPSLEELASSLGYEEESKIGNTKNASIVVQLGGEMGNNLQIISFGFCLKLVAAKVGINATIVLRHQDHSKWLRGRENTQACFIKTREMDFEAANTAEFDLLKRAQDEWLGDNATFLKITNTFEYDEIDDSLSYWKSLLTTETPPPIVKMAAPSPVSIPFLWAGRYIKDFWVDKFYDDIRELLVFDYTKCCKLQAEPDETVLHIRGYTTEMPGAGKRMGFAELSPNKVATELLSNLKSGEKVAILSRFGGKSVLIEPYVKALEARGLQVRVISGQTGYEDFCFLMSTQKEFVGIHGSSYASFAAYLGNMTRARLYFLDSPETRRRYGDFSKFLNFTWTHPILKARMSIELYKSEEQDARDKVPDISSPRWLRWRL